MAEVWRRNRQTISWFVDLNRRGLIDFDPPYQRRSVWNTRYREDFVETILLGYPVPSLFLHEEIDTDGNQRYAIVDGKQRLTAVMDFAADEFPTKDAPTSALGPDLQGKYFRDLDAEVRRGFFGYEFQIEYVPNTDELLINEVFDRYNRNVARLTRQELRHAKYNGVFAETMDSLADVLYGALPEGFPRIVESSRRQMKDIEFVTQLALLTERGPSSTGQDELDRVYAGRDEEWDEKDDVVSRFSSAVGYLGEVVSVEGFDLVATRLRNQVDFYSLFGAVLEETDRPDPIAAATRLRVFVDLVSDREGQAEGEDATVVTPIEELSQRYYEAARSAANDPGQRTTRIDALRQVMRGDI